jgi:hypothetical protein
MAIPYRPLFPQRDLNRALQALGVRVHIDRAMHGRTRSEIGQGELTGILLGALMLTLFGVDPEAQQEDFARSFHGWTTGFTSEARAGGASARDYDDAILGGLALNAMWTAQMLTAAAEQRYAKHQGTDARPGSVMAASRLANLAGQLAMTASADRAESGLKDTAAILAELEELLPMLRRIAGVHAAAKEAGEG